VWFALSVSVSATSKVGGKVAKTFSRTVYDIKLVTTAAGDVIEKKIPRKALFQTVMRKTEVPDPSDSTKKITIEVPQEVEYKANAKAGGKLNKLKDRLLALKRRERELHSQFAPAATKKRDWPVLEDGAPAKPNKQEIAAAQELYGELEAAHFPKAKNIRESDLKFAEQFAKDAGANRQAHWSARGRSEAAGLRSATRAALHFDCAAAPISHCHSFLCCLLHVRHRDFFNDIKEKMLVPKHAWSSTM